MNLRLKRPIEDFLYPALLLVVFLAAWEVVGRLQLVPRYILPPPSAIALRFAETYPILAWDTWITTVEIVLGFFLALIAGVGLAMAVVYIKIFERTFYPWIVATQAIPKIALGPLILVWFGFGLFPKVLIVCMISFFPIMIGTTVGLKSMEQESLFLMRSIGSGKLQTFWYATLPNGLPNIFAGMKIAIILASVGAIVAEFIGANEGLGYVLLTSNASVDTALLFAALVIIAVISTVLYWVVALIERVFIGWHVSVRSNLSASIL